MKAPPCRGCHKALQAYKYRKNGPSPFSESTLKSLRKRFGVEPEWGPYGDGLFCSLKCAHRWAVNQFKGNR